MSQNDHVTEPQSLSPLPQYQGESEDLEIQDIKCNTCGKTFTRLDHLRRHERGHTAEKPFACGECKRRFARLDVLRRHQSSHELSRKGGADGSRRYARACVACATARVKCSGGMVCHRCRSRDLQCGYPIRRNHSRATTRPDPQDGAGAIERDHDSGVAVSSFEDRSNSEVFELRPDEDVWSSQPVEVLEYNTSPVGQSHDHTGSGVTPTATGSSTQDVLPETSPMNTEDRLIRKDFIEPAQTIIPGACLSPHVSEVNIGSIYNYSKINWLPSGGQSQINRRTSAQLLQSIDSVSVNSQYTFPSENQDQLLQQSVQQNNITSNRSNASSPAVTISIAGSPSGVPMYYVDGDGAGLPIPAHQRQQSHSLFSDQNTSPLNHNNHDNLRVFNSYSNPDGEPGIWSSESYIALTEYLQRTPRRHLAVRHIDSLPSLEILNFFARLYFDKFHSSFPLLHKGTFLSSRNGCLLELVISAIGACYVRTPYARKSSESLHELAYELLKIDKISDDSQREFPNIFGLQQSERYQSTTRLQASILNVLGMFHSGNPKLTSFAREDCANLVTACIENQMLTSDHYSYLQGASAIGREEDQILQGWLEGELKCRAGYFVWMLDCMMAYESGFRTHMNLSDGKAPLPCPEQIWDQPVPPMSQLLILNSGPPSLCSALNVLYTEKILVPNLGELSRILLIHGMYRRIWEVSRYHNDSLSDWVPTSLSEPRHTVTSGRSTRPWSNPVISRWINGSCDCLDVLHWSAYTTILQASGFEHPTVLQLHFSRLILLAPVSDLQELAKAKLHQESRRNSNSYLFPTVQDQVCPKSLVDWVVHDQSKARLAIIHAGSVFWHLRRYSCGSVIEPFAKYLATLVIWAYNVASLAAKSTPNDTVYEPHGAHDGRIRRTSSTSRQNQDLHHTTISEDANNLNPSSPYSHVSGGLEQLGTHGTTIIQLDRPCDDELVHMFVRFGDEMTPYMAQIGDIKQGDAAGKILKEGIRLLSSHDDHKKRGGNDTELGGGGRFIWGIAGEFVALLDALGSSPV